MNNDNNLSINNYVVCAPYWSVDYGVVEWESARERLRAKRADAKNVAC